MQQGNNNLQLQNVDNNLLRYACSISPDDDTMIMTGGYDTLKTVSLYDRQGWSRDLANLNTGRKSHACGHFANNIGEKV